MPGADCGSLCPDSPIIEQWCQIQHGVLPGTIADAWANEGANPMPLGRAFDGFVEHAKRVSPTCLIHFERTGAAFPMTVESGTGAVA